MLQTSAKCSPPKRRWRRILLVIASALVLAVIAIQILFLTDVPRNLVISAAEKQTGLSVSADSLSTGFLGHTSLNDVTVALPTGGDPILRVPSLTLDHTWLLGLLVGNSITVHTISIDRPQLNLVQNQQGIWNVDEAAQVIDQASKPSTPNSSPPTLPAIGITDATVTLTDNHRRTATIDHVNFTTSPNRDTKWHGRLVIPDHLDVRADVTPGGTWTHEANFDIKNARGIVAPWISNKWPLPAQIQGKWDGSVQNGRLLGKLALADTTIRIRKGSITGNGYFDTANPYQSRFDLTWKDIAAADIQPYLPAVASATGTISGSLHIHPADFPHPLEPLAALLQIHTTGVVYKGSKIGDFQAAAFFGPGRFVVDDAPQLPNQLIVDGNLIHFWGRVSKHLGGIYQSLLQINLHDIQLDTLLPAGTKIAKTPGMLGGQITMVGELQDPSRIICHGTLTLDKSDLAGTGPIAFLYNLMRVGHDAKKPTGAGTIDFTVQNSNIYLSAVRYFDKGIEVRLSGEIDNITALPHSPVAIIAVGSARPLASLHIPGLSDFDDALGTIQRSAFAISITGYLDKPHQKRIPFSDVGHEMKALLFGDAKTIN